MSRICVQICYATPVAHTVLDVTLAEGATLAQAVSASGILRLHPDINLQNNAVGVYAEIRSLESVLKDGDRVEIYRRAPAHGRKLRK